MQTTKNQHLVWKKYLARWTDSPETTEGNIHMCLKGTKKTIPTSLLNVGVERYTYDISMATEQDREFAAAYFNKWLLPRTQLPLTISIPEHEALHKKDYLETTFFDEIEKLGIPILNGLYREEFPFDAPSIPDQIVQFLQIALVLRIYGTPLLTEEELKKMSEMAMDHLQDADPRFDFFQFFSAQFFRTWFGRRCIENATEKTRREFPDSLIAGTSKALFPILTVINTFIMATQLVRNNYYIELVKNKTAKNFITGDAPIINLYADYSGRGDDAELTKADWYYPVTPKLAIICKNSISKNVRRELTDENQVLEYNRKIYEAAEKQVYALNKEDFSDVLRDVCG